MVSREERRRQSLKLTQTHNPGADASHSRTLRNLKGAIAHRNYLHLTEAAIQKRAALIKSKGITSGVKVTDGKMSGRVVGICADTQNVFVKTPRGEKPYSPEFLEKIA